MKSRQGLRTLLPLIFMATGLVHLLYYQGILSPNDCAPDEPHSSKLTSRPISRIGSVEILPPKVELPNDSPRRIAFIHVGKAGGNTVRSALPRLQCFRKRQPSQRVHCHEATARAYSPLSEASDVEIHMSFGMKSWKRSQNNSYTSLLYAIRNPLERIQSAFDYLHPNNTESYFAQQQNQIKTLFYRDCFPTFHALVRAVDQVFEAATAQTNTTTTTTTLTVCQELAITSLQGQDELIEDINVHFYYNYQHYANLEISQSTPEVFVVRTESIWEDLIDLDRSLNGLGWFQSQGEVLNQGPSSEADNNRVKTKKSMLTAQSRQHLCCVLWKEMAIYQQILQQAVNLNQDDKASTMKELTDMCGINSQSTSDHSVGIDWMDWQKQSCPDLDRLVVKDTS